MKQVIIASFLMLLTPRAAVAQMNPYQIGMQYCQMVNNGVSRKKAWDYVISSYANTSPFGVNRGDPYAPWSPTNTIGGAIGSGIASGIAMGLQLRSMKGDIQRVINTNCPGGNSADGSFGSGSGSFQKMPNVTERDIQIFNSDYCAKNPWERKCNIGNPVMNTYASPAKVNSSDCNAILQKYDCKYTNYLEANPHMRKWVEANPVMARKEALRLKALDADEIGSEKSGKLSSSADNRPKSAAERAVEAFSPRSTNTDCLKASDYKGCMEYHNPN